jgi:hypothetical protein
MPAKLWTRKKEKKAWAKSGVPPGCGTCVSSGRDMRKGMDALLKLGREALGKET